MSGITRRLAPCLLALRAALPLACEPGARPEGQPEAKPAPGDRNPNVRFGQPSPARADPDNEDEYLIERPQFVLSYSNKKKTPNWVSWVRHDVADVAVLRPEDGPTAPAVLRSARTACGGL